ncbi:MAG: diacylglycerol kinase family protein [Candidatus Ureaplasma intestinipullorum]|uniref:Diacylglycerol kinase family protein n=1 Tax=Candidatus Ureaplasma intestinipullorum TaxID=2838770 RepID=A0A9E2KXU9_9BACT|nr:diacylglycerol kinase family protein [Candidatus Ureaplasma intestinipullorum]
MNFDKKILKLLRKFGYAIKGLRTSIKEEKSLVIHLIIAFLTLIAGMILQLNTISWAIIIVVIAIVISSELINTTIENLVDMVSFKFNFNAKKIKDVAAASTLILAICAIIVAFLIFIPRIIEFANFGYGYNGWN